MQPPRIAFPPNGATVSLDDPKKPQALPLRAQGGRAPLRWVISGLPLEGQSMLGTESWWTPEGEGFARITVVDADGRSDTAQIRLKAEN